MIIYFGLLFFYIFFFFICAFRWCFRFCEAHILWKLYKYTETGRRERKKQQAYNKSIENILSSLFFVVLVSICVQPTHVIDIASHIFHFISLCLCLFNEVYKYLWYEGLHFKMHDIWVKYEREREKTVRTHSKCIRFDKISVRFFMLANRKRKPSFFRFRFTAFASDKIQFKKII